eukprot:2979607-Rhodomonas_salina.2
MSVRGARAETHKAVAGQPFAFEVTTPSTAMMLAADDEEQRRMWVDAINDAGEVQCLARKRMLKTMSAD